MTELITEVGRWWAQAWQRLQPDLVPASAWPVAALVLAVVAAVVLAPPLWRGARVLVTVVHELGHGLVGLLCGRRFTGLVLRGDMSGHAVTVGPSRGAGRALTTWAGYPAPAVVGAAAVQLAAAGWAPPVLAVTALLLLGALVRVRSIYTAAVMVALTAVTAALWWWGSGVAQASVVLGMGAFLLVGSWRHLGAVVRHSSPASDPAVLAQLTRVPRWCWHLTFVVVLAAANWWALAPVLELGGLGR
ncbi:M50 family metallopeptidase [Georgenia sp. SYP-B2076]|uniref:M50 family metallopeptidase n=1 Tax=Georgenia sp. SYP-B2076 TaxID=2495881 RepID=UPI001F0C42AB|nr:M50 family metallopeptidase [Georgenia sp. SYP-B2076]